MNNSTDSPSKAKILLAALLAWLVPGLGHFFLGKYIKALFFFGILTATYIAGLWMSGFRTVSWTDNPFYYVGHLGSGITLLLGTLLSFEKAAPLQDKVSWFDPGLLYVCVVGMLNVLITLSIFDTLLYKKSQSSSAEGKVEDLKLENPHK